MLRHRPQRDGGRAFPGDRTGLGRCSSGRVLRDAWSCGGGAGGSRRGAHPLGRRGSSTPGHSAGDTEGVSFRQGHNGEILAAALRPAFLHRFCKEPVLEVLAFWAGARPGNYNLLAQIPPAVSKVRSIQPAPSSLVLPLRFCAE